MQIESLDPGTCAYSQNLYKTYAYYRKNDPVHAETILGRQGFSLYKYDDVCTALKDPRFSSTGVADELIAALEERGLLELAEIARDANLMTGLNEPDHGRIRRIIQKPLLAKPREKLVREIRLISDELLSGLDTGVPFDLVEAYATPLALKMITQLIGIPCDDLPKLLRWSDDFEALLDTSRVLDSLESAEQSIVEFREFLRPILKARRSEPRDDVVTALMYACHVDETITEAELVGNCLLTLAAGNLTSRHLIGNAVQALESHPDQLAILRKEPERVPSAVEEILRYEAPIQMTGRTAIADLNLGGTDVPRGSPLRIVLGSANRDPERFDSPDTLDVKRVDLRHVSFGGGIHRCLGANLGRLECQIALSALLERFDEIEFAGSDCEWLPGHTTRGLARYPVILH